MISGEGTLKNETMRGLLDDKSSIHADHDSINDTMTRFGENNSILNMSDAKIRA